MDNVSGIADAIRKATEAYTEALAAVTKALQNLASQAGGADRERVVENWLAMSLAMMQMSIKTLELQKASLEAMRSTHGPGGARSPSGKG